MEEEDSIVERLIPPRLNTWLTAIFAVIAPLLIVASWNLAYRTQSIDDNQRRDELEAGEHVAALRAIDDRQRKEITDLDALAAEIKAIKVLQDAHINEIAGAREDRLHQENALQDQINAIDAAEIATTKAIADLGKSLNEHIDRATEIMSGRIDSDLKELNARINTIEEPPRAK